MGQRYGRNPSTVLMELVFNTRGRLGRERGRPERGKKTKWFCPVRSRPPFTGIAFAENLLLVRGLELKGRRARERITSGRKNTAPRDSICVVCGPSEGRWFAEEIEAIPDEKQAKESNVICHGRLRGKWQQDISKYFQDSRRCNHSNLNQTTLN